MTTTQKDRNKRFAAGDIIMRQGERGDCAYIIEDGLVEILIEKSEGRIQSVGTRGPGTIVGEMALVDDAPRVATVKAVRDCTMLPITRADFGQRLKSSDPVIQMITQVILTRYRDTLTRAEILGESLTYPPVEALERRYTEQTDIVESVKIAHEFRDALENGDVQLHYQPIIDLSNGHIAGFEALMRWTHPERGPISPGLFIPIAEKSGLIVEVGQWAMEESCRALKRMGDAVPTPKPLYMSVNFSSHDFADENFVKNVDAVIRKTGIAASQLKLEITERLLIQQPDNAKATLNACRELGTGIAIDDFGTGYSSLSYLYYFPIDILKVDQSFIRAMFCADRSLELVKSIIGLGKNLNLTVIAEGVEHVEEARLLRDVGCDMAQGYHFARPMAEEDMTRLLACWNPKLKLSA